jgi:hypothetical protein
MMEDAGGVFDFLAAEGLAGEPSRGQPQPG